MGSPADLCRCGHDRDRHQHFRDLAYCGTCPRGECRRFQRDPLDRPVLSWLRRRLARVREG